MNSIRNRLLLWQTVALIATAVLVTGVSYILAWNGFNKVRDFALEQFAHTVAAYTEDEDPPLQRPSIGTKFVSQIWDSGGRLIYASMPDLDLPRQPIGLSVISWKGQQWHTFALHRNGRHVMVASTTTNREIMFEGIAGWLIVPTAAMIVMLGVLLIVVTRAALRPLATINQELEHRDAGDLTPMAGDHYPDEIAPLVATLNRLLTSLQHALEIQRRFTADAAHELRTPLAGISIQAEIALAAEDVERRSAALGLLRQAVSRASHLVEQLLHLARLEPNSADSGRFFQPVRVDQMATAVVCDFSAIADTKDIDLGLGTCETATSLGNAESLRVMLNNLVDNAIRYGRVGGRIDIEVKVAGNQVEVSVSDDGPGIPASSRQAVFERFRRLPNSGESGSGLGLAIVKEVVGQFNGDILLEDSSLGGLRVRVRLPLALNQA